VSGGTRTWLSSLGGTLAVLGVPFVAEASHPKPGSEVPWGLLIVAAVAVFAAAWGLTVYFERRQKGRSNPSESREQTR
jgi:hypothetical protein